VVFFKAGNTRGNSGLTCESLTSFMSDQAQYVSANVFNSDSSK